MQHRDNPMSPVVGWLCALAAAVGALGLIVNILDAERLLILIPHQPRMQLGTSISVLVAASAIALQRARHPTRTTLAISRAAGVLVLAYGTLVIVEYGSGANLHIDWQVRNAHALRPHHGRMSPFAALALAALGGVLLLRGEKFRWLRPTREGLCLVVIAVAMTALFGHLYGAGALYAFMGSRIMGVALPTSLALSALGIAAWISEPPIGLLRIVTAPGPGGRVMRQLGTAAVVGVPLLFGVFLLFVSAFGLSDLSLVLAIASVLGVASSLSMLAATAGPIERSAEASEASRRRAEEVFELAPLGVFIADLSGRYTDVNTAGCQLLGYTRDEVLEKTIFDLLPENDIERLLRSREQMLAGEMDTQEWKLQRKDGTYAPAEVTANVLPDGRWQGFVRDISYRRELEDRLHESTDFMQRVLESSTEHAIIAEDIDGRVVLWNEGARRTYGYAADEIHGQSSEVLLPAACRREWTELHTRAHALGEAVANLLACRKDGTTFSAYVVCTLRQGPDGTPAGVLLVIRDLTVEQRQLAEQQFLSRVGVELAASLDMRETVARVTQLATDFFGDLGTVDLIKGDGLTRLAAIEREGAAELARDLTRLGSLHAPGHPLATVIETKQPLLLAQIRPEDRARYATSAAHARTLERVNATSAMLVPLIARGQLLAVLSIAARDGRRTYGADDLRLAMELGRRAALTLDNVQLLQQSRLQGAVTTNLAEAVIVVRPADSSILYANLRAETMFGFAARDLRALRNTELHVEHEAFSAHAAQIAEQLERNGAWHGELECVRRDGTRLWCSVSISNFDHEWYGRVWIVLYTDVTERRRLEQQSARTLSEKEVLLREIHHRVKNNLQVISSLFSLQRERTQNRELRILLDESRIRIASIALVHEQLYRASDLAAVDFDEYLRSLVHATRSSYGADGIEVRVSARHVLLELDQAVPCALLICELVSNSFRHAFDTPSGKVWVRAERDTDGFYVLEVGDNGRGLPPGFDCTKARSLGLKLVLGLARQMRGSITVESAHGTCFRLRFPSAHARARGADSVASDGPDRGGEAGELRAAAIQRSAETRSAT
jgi:PAS domain S-box-containing protein